MDMNTAISFKTPNGEDMIVLSKSDYDMLLERAELVEDIAAIEIYRKRLAADEEEAIPEEFAVRLIEGENPIRVYREMRRMSAKELAERSGVSAAFLSEIERGKKGGGIVTLKKIALELNVMLDDLVTGE
jgi:DNA-binding XRE family transcriptional regulator